MERGDDCDDCDECCKIVFSDDCDHCKQCKSKFGTKGSAIGRVMLFYCGHSLCFGCASKPSKNVQDVDPARCKECNIVIMGWYPVRKSDIIDVTSRKMWWRHKKNKYFTNLKKTQKTQKNKMLTNVNFHFVFIGCAYFQIFFLFLMYNQKHKNGRRFNATLVIELNNRLQICVSH